MKKKGPLLVSGRIWGMLTTNPHLFWGFFHKPFIYIKDPGMKEPVDQWKVFRPFLALQMKIHGENKKTSGSSEIFSLKDFPSERPSWKKKSAPSPSLYRCIGWSRGGRVIVHDRDRTGRQDLMWNVVFFFFLKVEMVIPKKTGNFFFSWRACTLLFFSFFG